MKISVFGLGYVGSVTAVCLAALGHDVCGVDIVPQKVAGLNQGVAPVREPQLDELLQENLEAGRLRFATDPRACIRSTDCAFISVGTPTNAKQEVELNAVTRCIETIAEELIHSEQKEYLIVIHSTVPPDTTRRMQALADQIGHSRNGHAGHGCRISVCMNPEFLREGSAVQDFFHPAMTVFGLDDPTIRPQLEEIYAGIDAPEVWVDSRTAELLKYVNNAFHAIKVAFANEVGRLAGAFDIDGSQVMELLCADKKLNISSRYLRPGFAFGGSCLPKDLRGINSFAGHRSVDTPLLHAILQSNDAHIEQCKELIAARTTGQVGVLGVAFKSGTDDVRESPAIRLIRRLTDSGIDVRMTDVNLQPGQMMGANRKYIDEMLPDWQERFSEKAADLFDFSDTIVLTNHEPVYLRWIDQYGAGKTILHLYNQSEAHIAVTNNS